MNKSINLSLDHLFSMLGTPTITAKSINSKWSNAGLQDSSPTHSGMHLVLVTCYNTCTDSLEDRRKDARLGLIYKFGNENVDIAEQVRRKPPLRQSRNIRSSSFSIPPCKTQ